MPDRASLLPLEWLRDAAPDLAPFYPVMTHLPLLVII